MKISAFPKIHTLGTRYVKDIFDVPVWITEKINGSQFAFGVIDGELLIRSKGEKIHIETPEKMFTQGVEYVISLYENEQLHEGDVYYCEYLQKPKHNVLSYGRIPKNHLMMFAFFDSQKDYWFEETELPAESDRLGIECVPLLYTGMVESFELIENLMKQPSCLDHSMIEGVVIKNYRDYLLGNQYIPLTAAKYVSERFKEVHAKEWSKTQTSKGKWETFKSQYSTEARWEKAVQHLKDSGKLVNQLRDIGGLIKEVQSDITEEEKENIKEGLWKVFSRDLLRESTKGLPEWYKKKLAEDCFNE